MLASFQFSSELLRGPRQLWVQPAAADRARNCFIFQDADLYIERVKAPEIARDLQAAGRLAPVTCVYLSNGSAAARHVDFACNEQYSRFLATELVRWISDTLHPHDRFWLAGLSLSGLAAAFTALRHPAAFSGVLCQSPSAWWNDEWLAASLTLAEALSGRFWISVGNQELQEGVSHPPSGMFQKSNQLDSVRRLSQQLKSAGHVVRHAEFSGGHDPHCWAAELPVALEWLLRCDT